MIRLTKGKKPNILEQNADAWTKELLDKIANNEEPSKYLLSRYSHSEIKTALLAETSEKCAYCESPLRHIAYGDIEHIIPKSVEPESRFSWENLTISCDICNTKKSDTTGLVDPYSCDPETLFTYHGPLMWADPSAHSAVLTEELLDLNRNGLIERRKERIEYLRNLVASAASKSEDIRNAMMRRAENEIGADRPYSACGKAILNQLRLKHQIT
jgi:uncharacterized protein (TIGR02646 family)